jgi:segregation and condensation protein B
MLETTDETTTEPTTSQGTPESSSSAPTPETPDPQSTEPVTATGSTPEATTASTSEATAESSTPTQAELPGTEATPTPDVFDGPDADREDPARALEALIFAAHGPASATHLRRAFPDLTPARIGELVKEINDSLSASGRPYEIIEVANGFQFRTRAEYGPVIASAQPERKVRLSAAALDTLAVAAYRQPITRAEIEEMRSVDCGAVIRSLLERNLLRILGRRDAPGRPALYGTTSTFLEVFGLRSLRDLPELRQLIEPPAETGTPIEDAATATPEGDALAGAAGAPGVPEPGQPPDAPAPGPAQGDPARAGWEGLDAPAPRAHPADDDAELAELDAELAELNSSLKLQVDLGLEPDADDDERAQDDD